jgi:AcrR family transcriptional regulator
VRHPWPRAGRLTQIHVLLEVCPDFAGRTLVQSEHSLAFVAKARHTAAMSATRRRPAQERSRQTVERIVDAGAAVLAERGYHQASTNRIAAAAGVSPGTLYGYFADKDEIVAAVIDRVVDGFGDAVSPALRLAVGRPIEEATRLVLDAVLAELEDRAALVEAFIDRVPAERYAPRVDALRERVSEITFHLVAASLPGVPTGDLERAVWFAVRTVEHLTVRYALQRPAIPREAFLDSLTGIVVGLAPTGPSAP